MKVSGRKSLPLGPLMIYVPVTSSMSTNVQSGKVIETCLVCNSRLEIDLYTPWDILATATINFGEVHTSLEPISSDAYISSDLRLTHPF
jgi:galactitol-specific phosphotransferase system IIC component